MTDVANTEQLLRIIQSVKIPRTEVNTCNRDDIKGVGVYFLICQEDDGTA